MVVFGYILAVLLPIAGLVLGIVVISQGPRNHGIGIVALSTVIGTVSYMLLF